VGDCHAHRPQVDVARADGRDVYDGDDDLTDWTDDQIRELACDMLSIDRRHAHRIDVAGHRRSR
jgi:hypothetical protein